MSRSNSCDSEPARSSSSSRSCVLRSSESLRPPCSVSAARRACSVRISPTSSLRSVAAGASPPRGPGCDRSMARESSRSSGAALHQAAPIGEIIAPAAHQSNEGGVVLRQHRGAQALDRLGQGLERLRAVVIEALYFIIQLGTFPGDLAGHIQLGVEGRARHARQPWRRLTAVRERGEECDVEGVPEAQDRKSTRLNSSHLVISYAVFCLKKKKR